MLKSYHPLSVWLFQTFTFVLSLHFTIHFTSPVEQTDQTSDLPCELKVLRSNINYTCPSLIVRAKAGTRDPNKILEKGKTQ